MRSCAPRWPASSTAPTRYARASRRPREPTPSTPSGSTRASATRKFLAGAYVFLMRAAGVPARLVTGYRGGKLMALTSYVVVKRSHAYAWVEVWDDQAGWRRVDPADIISLQKRSETRKAARNSNGRRADIRYAEENAPEKKKNNASRLRCRTASSPSAPAVRLRSKPSDDEPSLLERPSTGSGTGSSVSTPSGNWRSSPARAVSPGSGSCSARCSPRRPSRLRRHRADPLARRPSPAAGPARLAARALLARHGFTLAPSECRNATRNASARRGRNWPSVSASWPTPTPAGATGSRRTTGRPTSPSPPAT